VMNDDRMAGKWLAHPNHRVVDRSGFNRLPSHLDSERPNDHHHIWMKIRPSHHSTVTLLAKLRGWSTSVPLAMAA
jgi:hypothetical protein